MALQPDGEVVEDRRRLVDAVGRALTLLGEGSSADAVEAEGIDFKEEAGRRGRAGVILPGQPRSEAVATQLADEVACLANTPSGGALIVGVADDGTVIGAVSERDWLRQRIHERVDIAPAVEERWLPDGTRLLVLLVAAAREPVENVAGNLRWRVGARCAPVDRSEWWQERLRRQGADPLTARTERTDDDISADAFAALRRLIRGAGPHSELLDLSRRDMLTRVGVLLPDRHLTAAGVHMLLPAPRTVVELVALDVPGGDVTLTMPDMSGLSLIEQLAEVEGRLESLDRSVSLPRGLQLGSVRQIPWLAVREALLNALVHRDWLPREAVHISWVEEDASMDVVSPGGFAGGVTGDTVLSSRYSRNPALADFARALGLVERQGVGVDRMYREMVTLGHRPPVIREEPGPQVRTRLVGGRPLDAVLAVTGAVNPVSRRRDVRVSLAIHALLRDGFVGARSLSVLLQVPADEAAEALDVAMGCSIDGDPLLVPGSHPVLLPGEAVTRRVAGDPSALAVAQRRGLMRWYRPAPDAARVLVRQFLAETDRISSSDLAQITGLTQQGALQMLMRMTNEGHLDRGSAARGRHAHFVARSPSAPS
ncbi:putative DNA binding domain-containing protein [Kineosporia sp. J2-2]|uniref:DNA binding domain-containing protein n=1 Tax=Kineosporia corallincola TaxID=2835133 RepID=A0ABS5TS90_9ACTN|nr:DUF5635 domain-containing protein [Kineosporia corallincola]MBT0773677.1 putative DNA binding domain-containing protein [Kineosporia corallincola]